MKLYDSISDDLAAWAQRQPVFFTGSASTHGAHVNVSPKGLNDTHFAIFGPNEVAYIDRTGSGCETIAHSYENGRLCLLFISFGPAPRILRLFCRSKVIEDTDPRFDDYVRKVAKGRRDAFEGARAVIVCHVWQVQTSCGYGVPLVKKGIYAGDSEDKDTLALLKEGVEGKLDELCVFENRRTLDVSAQKIEGKQGSRKYRATNNARSMDGLPGLRSSRRDAQENLWLGDLATRISRVKYEKFSFVLGFAAAVLAYVVLVVLQILPPPNGWENNLSKLQGVIPLRG